MDASWFERMNTIKDANEDGSFMGRVMAWKLSILMALNSPIWGGGFDAVAYGPTWRGLLSQWHLVSWIPSPVPVKGYVAHSIYFQVLGDMGFVGFFVFFSMIWVTYRKYKKLMRSPSSSEWLKTVSMYCTIAIVCYLVAGAALSVAYNEIILMLIALSMRLSQNVQNANNKLPFNIH
jgi:O-antigen ligase